MGIDNEQVKKEELERPKKEAEAKRKAEEKAHEDMLERRRKEGGGYQAPSLSVPGVHDSIDNRKAGPWGASQQNSPKKIEPPVQRTADSKAPVREELMTEVQQPAAAADLLNFGGDEQSKNIESVDLLGDDDAGNATPSDALTDAFGNPVGSSPKAGSFDLLASYATTEDDGPSGDNFDPLAAPRAGNAESGLGGLESLAGPPTSTPGPPPAPQQESSLFAGLAL